MLRQFFLVLNLFLFIILNFNIHAQTFSGLGGLVNDNGGSITEFTIDVRNITKDSLVSNSGLVKVCFNLQHPNNEELTIWIVSPDNTSVILTERLGGNSVNYTNTCVDMTSNNYIANNWGPFTGTFRSYHHLGKINNGGKANGKWKLRIKDNAKGNAGNLLNWSIQLASKAPTGIATYTSSKLPVFKINTNNTIIVDDPKRIVDFELIDNTSRVNKFLGDSIKMKGKIGIEFRGSSSQWFPKKSYGFEFVDSANQEIKRSILGMPEESDWILSASFTDKSLMNNMMAYDFYRKMGHFATRTKYVDLVIDDEYQGIFILMEKIKQDNNRVNIAKLEPIDTSDIDVTGGYIFKIDKFTAGTGAGWNSHIPPVSNPNGQLIYFQYDYPNPKYITKKQESYIQEFVKEFEDTLYYGELQLRNSGWRKYADEISFIHYLLLNEFSRNTDGYRLSTYLFKSKDKKDSIGKLSIGPPWDYDIAFGNINYCRGQDVTGWAYDFGLSCSGDGFQIPFWWSRMLEDTLFVNQLQCEYRQLRRTIWSDSAIVQYIDSTQSAISESVKANFNLWPILGLYIWPNPNPLPTTIVGEINELKDWMLRRLDWLDINIPGTCIITETELILEQYSLDIIPNPAQDYIIIKNLPNVNQALSLDFINLYGKIISKENIQSKVDIKDIPDGTYQVRIRTNKNKSSNQLLVIIRQ